MSSIWTQVLDPDELLDNDVTVKSKEGSTNTSIRSLIIYTVNKPSYRFHTRHQWKKNKKLVQNVANLSGWSQNSQFVTKLDFEGDCLPVSSNDFAIFIVKLLGQLGRCKKGIRGETFSISFLIISSFFHISNTWKWASFTYLTLPGLALVCLCISRRRVRLLRRK